MVTSCLGFGCASLGSRISAGDGLRALAAAAEAGVTWFDLAPAYGGGRAEAIAGPFLSARRERVRIATKVGLAASPSRAGLAKALMPIARRAVGLVPPLRNALRRTQAPLRLTLTPELIRTSLEASLRRLGTDHVDLYALHDAAPEDLGRDAILRVLEDLVAAGKTRTVAVASDAAAARAALTRGAPFAAIQLAMPAPGEETGVLAAARAARFGLITHSVFGVEGALERLGRRAADPAVAPRLREATGIASPSRALARLLLARAFALNPEGVVLVSMFSERSRAENLAAAAEPPGAAACSLLDEIFDGAIA
jgi:aryl-alcohol dehydrogenase-like predicted oxidoreductase